jgi:hypothetical protein
MPIFRAAVIARTVNGMRAIRICLVSSKAENGSALLAVQILKATAYILTLTQRRCALLARAGKKASFSNLNKGAALYPMCSAAGSF